MRIKILILLLMASTHVAAIFSGAVLHERLLSTPNSPLATPHSETPLARTERLALAGDTQAAFALASRYLIGDGVPQDPVTAYAWLILSQRNESPREQTEMLRCYHDAVSVPQREQARQRASELWQKMPH